MNDRRLAALIEGQNVIRAGNAAISRQLDAWAKTLEKQLMTIQEEIAATKTALLKTQGDVATLAQGVTDLNTKIATLTAASQGDELSPETQAALDDLEATAGTLATTADAAAAELPVPPAPPAQPASAAS